MPSQLEILHRSLKANNYDVPDDFESFKSTLEAKGDEGYNNRYTLWRSLKDNNYDVPDDYNTFRDALFAPVKPKNAATGNGGRGTTTNRTATTQSRPDGTGTGDWRQQMIANAGNIVRKSQQQVRQTENQVKYNQKRAGLQVEPVNLGQNSDVVEEETGRWDTETGAPEKRYLTSSGTEYDQRAAADLEENTNDLQEYEQTVPGQLRKIDEQIASLEQRISEQENQREIDWVDADGRIHYTDGRTSDEAISNLDLALRDLKNARTMLQRDRQLQKSSNFLGGVGLPFTADWFNNWKNFGYGIWDSLNDRSMYDFGLSDLQKAGAYMRIKNKIENGEELTEQETDLALAGMALAQAEQSVDLPTGYTAGEITAQMAPFMAQMAANPASGVGRAFARSAVRKFGRDGVKAVAMRAGARVLGNVAEAAALTGTLQAGQTAANIMNRYTGDTFEYDEEGKLHIGHYEEGEDGQPTFVDGGKGVARSIYEGVTSSIIENFTELGFGGNINKFLGKMATSKSGRAIGLGYITDLVGKVGSTPFARGMKKFAERTNWNGLIEEPLEEEYGIILNSILTGDNKISDLWDSKQQTDIFAGTMWFGGFMAGMNLAAYPFARRKMKKDLRTADINGQYAFGDEWNTIKSGIEEMDDKAVVDYLYGLKDDDNFNNEQKAALFAYTSRLKQYQGANTASMLMRMEGNLDENEAALQNAYESGSEAEGPERNEVLRRYEAARQVVAEGLGVSDDDVDGELATYGDEREIMDVARFSNYGNDLLEYLNARAAYNGMLDRVGDDIEAQVQASNEEVKRNSNEAGQVVGATMKADGSQVYIVSGFPGVSETLVVRNAETGELKMIAPDALESIEEPIDAEELRRQREEEITNAGMQQAENEIEGKRQFQPNDVVTLADGRQGQLGPLTPEGTFLLYTDDNKVVPLTNDELNELATSVNGSPLEAATVSQQTEQEGEYTENAENYAQNEGENIPEEETAIASQQTGQEAESANGQPVVDADAMPMIGEGENAEPDFSRAEPERAHRFVYDEAGLSRDEANQFIDANKKAADSALAKLQKKQPKIGTSLAKYRKEQSAWQQQVDEAQRQVDYWANIQSIQKERERAEQELVFQERQEEATGRQSLLDEQRDLQAKAEVAKKMYGDYFDDDFTMPHDVMELVAMNMPRNISWEGRDGVRGLQQELGLKRGVGRNADSNAFNSYLAKKGQGVGVEQAVHNIWESAMNELPNGDKRYDDSEIRNALIDMFMSAEKPSDIRDYVLNARIAEAEATRAAEDEAMRAAEFDAWADAYHLTPEEREDFEDYISSTGEEISRMTDEDIQNIITIFANANQNTIDYEQNRRSQEVDRESDGRRAGRESEGSQAEVQEQGTEEIGVPDSYQQGPEGREATENREDISGDNVSGGALERPDVDVQRMQAIRQALTDAYRSGDETAIGLAAEQVQAYVDEGFDDYRTYDEAVDDYEGREPEMLADQYITHVFLDRYVDDDEDQEYIVTGLKPWMRESTTSVLPNMEEEAAMASQQTEQSVESKSERILNDGLINFLDQIGVEDLTVVDRMSNDEKVELDNLITDWEEVNDEYGRVIEENRDKIHSLNKAEKKKAKNAVGAAQMRADAAFAPVEEYVNELVTKYKVEEPEEDVSNDAEVMAQQTENELGTTSSAEEIAAQEARVDTNPTEAQKEAGNYQKGHIKVDGYDITIENPKGSVRSGVDDNGQPWEVTMNNTYGYIRGTEGVDGDHIDVFLSDEPTSGNVFVVDQVDQMGIFDEHKVMYGFASEEEARAAYLANYSPVWQGLGGITEVSREEFKKWVESSHRKTKPFAEYKGVKKETPAAKPAGTVAEPKKHASKKDDAAKPQYTEQQEPKRLVSDERMEELKKRLRSKLGGQLNVGVDPEVLAIGAEMAVGYIERGVTQFADYARAMINEVGDFMRPYLKSFYNAVRDMPEAQAYAGQMDDYQTVSSFDVFNFDKEQQPSVFEKAEQITKEETVKRQTKEVKQQQPSLFDDLFGTSPAIEKVGDAFTFNGFIYQIFGIDDSGSTRWYQYNIYETEDDFQNGKAVFTGKIREQDLSDVLANETWEKHQPKKQPKTPWWKDENRPKSISPSDYRTYMTDEARNYFASHPVFAGWKRKDLAFVTAAVWDGVVVPYEALKDLPEIVEAEQVVKNATANGVLHISDEEREQHAQRLLDAEHGSAIFENGKIKKVNGVEDFSGPVRQERKALIIIGYPAAGKSSVFANRLSNEQGARIIDSDVVKPWLDGFDGGNGAGYVQNASSEVAERAVDIAVGRGDNIILPRIGGGSVFVLSAALKLAGYDVELYYNDVATVTSVDRATSRFAETGRYLSLHYLTSKDGVPSNNFINFAKKTLGDYVKELSERKVQELRGRLGRLLESETVDGKRLWQSSAADQGGYRTLDEYLSVLLGAGGTGITSRTGDLIFSYAEWKSNDVPFGEKPKEIWNSKSGKPLPIKGNEAESEQQDNGLRHGQRSERKPESTGQGTGQGSERADDARRRGGSEPNRTEQPGLQRLTQDVATQSQQNGRNTDWRVPNGDASEPVPTRPAGELSGSGSHSTQFIQPQNLRNNRAERGKDYAPKGVDARIEANIKAIELMQQLIEDGKEATPAQMKVLRQYSGWGGLGKAFENYTAYTNDMPTPQYLQQLLGDEAYQQANMSRNSAYYTPAMVIDSMWDIARAMGFRGGNVLEGSAGIGNIIGAMPKDMSERSSIHAVEIDQTTGNILSLLYPDAKVEVQGFEQTEVENGSVDLAITNVPFVTGLRVMDTTGDKDLSKKFHDIHDFCIAKNIRKLREGGIGIFISSSGTLDNNTKLREWIVGEGGADVVGAFRLNNETFGGTGATSDIIVVRKRVNGKKSANAIDVLPTTGVRVADYDTGETKKVKGEYVPVVKQLSMDYNKYFVEHPEYMGGEMKFAFEEGDTFRPTSKALYPVRGKNQEELLKDWVTSFAGKEWEAAVVQQQTEQQPAVYEELGADVKEGSMVVSNGELCVAQRGKAVPLGLNATKVKGKTKVECFNSYQSIKKSLAEVLAYQTENEGDEGLQPLLDKLNRAYDNFVRTFGHLHKNTSIAFLRNDVDWPNILALEKFAERATVDGKRVQEYGKTDIFKARVVEKEKEPTVDNVRDGIIASIYQFGRINVPWMVEQLNKVATQSQHTEQEVRDEIVKSGLGFEDPGTKEMIVSYEYLSGNVREKLQQAQDNNSDGRYDANIRALEKVVPMDIPAHLIDFSIGSSWIDSKLYEDYVKEKTGIEVQFTNAGGTWYMKAPRFLNEEKNRAMGVHSEMLRKTVFGTQLIEAAMQNKSITVSETHKKWDGSTETIIDKEATAACGNKIDEIRQDFKDWARGRMQADDEYARQVERKYNDMFNNYVPKSIPDEFVPAHFGGATTKITLRPHQAKAVIRGTTQPLLLAHEVGTGKTFTLISTAMEMRRLGTARKPMIVVQNATVGQFVESAKVLYPNAKVLTLEDKDHTGEGRKNFYAKIKYNDWDMIVVPQSVFERIPDSEERQMAYIQDKIDEKMAVLEQMKDADAYGESAIVRQAEKEIEQLQAEKAALTTQLTERKKEKDEKKAAVTRQNAAVRAQEMLDRETDDVENFDDMGIDAILVDEAHEYKHLGFATAMQRGVKGVDPSYSKKAQGVYLKTQAVLEKNNGRNVIFATGTPISNTAAEIWTFMRYLMPADTMKEYDIYYFDDFVRNFGNLQQMLEFTTSGKFKENNRFAGYVNLPELVRIWSGVADTVLTKEAGGVKDKIPELEGGKAQDLYLPQTKALRSVMKFVKAQLEEYEKMSGKEKKENSHIPLTMYGIAKAAAVDARLVVDDAQDDEHSKTNEAVRQTLKSLEETKSYKGTVAIFADNYQNKHSGFNLYEDIRKKLIAAGVPEEQIVVMKSGMSVKKKLEIFDKVNRGEVRVIMGSTFTLGTGVNIQERLHTLIHVDAPNRPMDYTQRNGRILRQGNLHKEMGKPVRVLRFGVEDSLDVTAYQRLKTKGAIADSIMNGKQMMANSMENRVLEEEEDVFGDTVAQLSGSEYAMLKNQAEKDVRKYEAKRKQWEFDQTYVHSQIPKLEGQIKTTQRAIEENKHYLERVATVSQHTGPMITIGQRKFESVEAMADYIKDFNKSVKAAEDAMRESGKNDSQVRRLTINVGGIDFDITTEISVEVFTKGIQLFTGTHRNMTYSCKELGIVDAPVKQSLLREALADITENVITGNDFRERIERGERAIERDKDTLQQLRERDGKPFEYADELAKAHERYDEYTELMKKELEEKEKKYAEMDAEVSEAADVVDAEEAEEDSSEDEGVRFRDAKAPPAPQRTRERTARERRQAEAYAQRQWRRAHVVADETIRLLGLEGRVTVMDFPIGLTGKRAQAKGWYDTKTGKTVVVMNNHRSPEDVFKTILHEGVAHYGLRQLFGDHFDTFLDEVYKNATPEIRAAIDAEVAVTRQQTEQKARREATEEYLARLAEDTDFERAMRQGWWQKIKSAFLDMLHKLGFGDYAGPALTDNELRYILWRSYENLKDLKRVREGQKPLRRNVWNPFKAAEDIVMQENLQVGNFEPTPEIPSSEEEEPRQAAEPKRPAMRIASMQPRNEAERTYAEFKERYGDAILLMHDGDSYFALGDDAAEMQELLSKRRIRGVMNDGRFELPASLIDFVLPVLVRADKRVAIKDDAPMAREGEQELEWVDNSLRFRSGGGFTSARAEYEQKTAGGAFKFRESWQDSMLALKRLQDAIAAESGEDIEDYENAYLSENRSHGKAKNEAEHYDRNYYQPLMQEVQQLVDYLAEKGVTDPFGRDGAVTYQTVDDYLKAKHGLERNQVFAFREAAKQKAKEVVDEQKRQLQQDADDGNITTDELRKELKRLDENFGKAVQDIINAFSNDPEVLRLKRNYENGMLTYSEYLQALVPIRKKYVMRAEPKKDDDGNVVSDNYYDEYVKDYGGLSELMLPEDYATIEALREMASLTVDPVNKRELYKRVREEEERVFEGAQEKAMNAVDAIEVDAAMKDSYDNGNIVLFVYLRDTAERRKHISDLWMRVNDATKKTLQTSYEGGMMSRDQYNNVRTMFDFYVPLRGWEEDNAEDVYDYVAKRSVFSPSVKKAYGRASKADSPLATIGNMAVSQIIISNKNLTRQHFLNMVLNHPSSLISVSEKWYIRVGDVNGQTVWEEREPDIKPGMTADEIASEIETFNEEMRLKQEQGDAIPAKGKLHLNLHATKAQKDEHVVEVQRNGKVYKLYINGNPRAAQALNGTNVTEGDAAWMQKLSRTMAANFTSRNPAFIISNLSRDFTMAAASVVIKEDMAYSKKFAENAVKVLRPRMGRAATQSQHSVPTGLLPSLMRKYLRDELDPNDETERYFQEFMEQGGETGFTNMLSVEKFKSKMEKEFKKTAGHEIDLAKAVGMMADTFEFYNRCAEDATRFIVYMTSRQMGKSVVKSIADAKDVTLNFNRKGAGGMGNATFRNIYIFVNPAIQALSNVYEMMMKHPLKFSAVTLSWVAAGAMLPILNTLMLNLLGGDDDKDEYWDLPDYVRKNNAVFWVPGTHTFVTIPLAQEFRVFYGIGELASAMSMGHTPDSWGKETLSSFMDLLPVNPTGAGGDLLVDFMPTPLQPIVQARDNVNFTGYPIYRDNQGNKYEPTWQKAYHGTPSWMVKTSKLLNEATGGNDHYQGWLDGTLTNPALWNHMLQGYLGGMYSFLSHSAGVITDVASGELPKMYEVPVANRFINVPMEREKKSRLGNEYYDLVEEHNRMQNMMAKYRKDAKGADPDLKKDAERYVGMAKEIDKKIDWERNGKTYEPKEPIGKKFEKQYRRYKKIHDYKRQIEKVLNGNDAHSEKAEHRVDQLLREMQSSLKNINEDF